MRFRTASRMTLFSLVVLSTAIGAATTVDAAPQRTRVRPALRKQIDRAIDRGLAYLVNGSIGTRGQRSGTHNTDGLALYAALHSGARRSDRKIESALEALARNSHTGTYVTACALMALSAGKERDHLRRIQRLRDRLIHTQGSGAWGYPSGEDLSNTQYAALGLWAAQRAGAKVPSKVWVHLAEALPEFTTPDGGFSYSRHGGRATMSMTAAGLACAALCREMLDKDGAGGVKLTDELGHSLELMEARAIEWIADRYAAGPPEKGHYALYGIERAAALTKTEYFGDHDWYAEGALYLVGTQEPTGEWKGAHGPIVTTCFSLLFLSRATSKVMTAPVSGPVVPRSALQAAKASRAPTGRDLERLHRRDLGRNRTAAAGARVKASTRGARRSADLVLDERRGTWWESSDHDKNPTLTFTFSEPASIDTILISHPFTDEADGEAPVRLASVTVTVNGKVRHGLTMPTDPRRKGRLELPRRVTLKNLKIECVRPEGVERVAIGEVEIQTRPH